MADWAKMIALLLTVLCFEGVALADPASPFAADRELAVGVKEAPPFVMKRPDGSLYGISIDLWNRLADRLHLHYQFSEQPDVQTLIRGTASGTLDAAIAAITVTSTREKLVDFTQPFYSSGLGIAVATNESKWVSILRTLFSFGFLQAVLALLGIALGVGFLVWLLERRETEHFGGGIKGLGTGFWWSAIAMTQAGAAHKAPATLPGRIVAMCWMIASIIAIAVFTAGLTATLTKREIQGAVHSTADLRSVRVGAPNPSTTEVYLDRERIQHRGYSQPKDGLKALEAGHLDAFVYDRPLLTWLVQQQFPDTLRVLDITFDSQNYAIALPKGSGLANKLNMAVLEETESDWWQQTLYRYLEKAQPSTAVAAAY